MDEVPQGQPLLCEVQRFREAWTGLLLFGGAALQFYIPAILVRELMRGDPRHGPGWALFLMGFIALLGLFVLWLAIAGAVVTEIFPGGIAVQFRPLTKRHYYRWDELESIEARTYRPILEYGGWGIRGLGKNRAYNVSGSEGLQLVFKNGKRLLIGSKMAGALEEAARMAQEASTK